MKLKHVPSPDTMPVFAEELVPDARRISGVELDFTPESLRLVDDIIAGFGHRGATLDDVLETLFSFGAYVGEVMVRNAGGAWRDANETAARGVLTGMVVQLPNGRIANPVFKCFKRIDDPADNLSYFYRVMTSDESSE